MKGNQNSTFLVLSLPLLCVMVMTSITSLNSPDFYARETANWAIQSLGQDMIDLYLVAPVLLLSTFFAWRGSRNGLLIWAGTNLFLVYTYCIYCFDIHFNSLFLFYCLNLGLAFYALMYFIYLQFTSPVRIQLNNTLISGITGLYFIIISICFYFLWLTDIMPAILSGSIPASLIEVGLPTNAVHVIDLSVFLPGLLIIGVVLLRRKSIGFILAPVCLVFFILMDITIGGLMVLMQQRGLEVSMAVAMAMGFLAFFSLILLILYFLETKKKGPDPYSTPSLK